MQVAGSALTHGLPKSLIRHFYHITKTFFRNEFNFFKWLNEQKILSLEVVSKLSFLVKNWFKKKVFLECIELIS
jgi:hypothetical protein